MAADTEFTENLADNEEVLILGGNGWSSKSGEVGWVGEQFNGTIENFRIYDEALQLAEIRSLGDDSVPLS